MESANEAATQLKQLRDLLLGRNPPVKKRCYRHQTQNSHLFCDSQWKFSPSFPCCLRGQKGWARARRTQWRFSKSTTSARPPNRRAGESPFFFFFRILSGKSESNITDHFFTLLQTWTQPVRVGAAAVHMQRICLPGEGAIHCQNPTSETGGAQPLWYRTSTQ